MMITTTIVDGSERAVAEAAVIRSRKLVEDDGRDGRVWKMRTDFLKERTIIMNEATRQIFVSGLEAKRKSR